MRKRIDLEYIFSSSVTILFSRLSSAPGLAEWFSDDVKHDGNIFTFVWVDDFSLEYDYDD